ncbi:50S ribosomal protein L11 [Candidatus Beckwithbacteria bacterium RBG_13_35_6]|uniref:Large ribosomal subunit protein uL11 n=1 Tax=Candidatus Beckwithbacteria bacterium RBG_13_35_6 TaxID=1797456 RepID=A0A1F5DF83_9BACT|nr:MAG: 50S ribosomal protein L11 [Candidatus Beckwithbacteria bacterium RBG_13_35_6]
MAKKIKTILKLNIEASKANPAPPIGPALGQHGVNIMQFCKEYNEKTKTMQGVIPAQLTIYEDRSFEFVLKKPPVAEYIKKKINASKGSQEPGRKKAGVLTQKDLEEIAKEKLADFNTTDLEEAKKIVAGSARSMGVEIKN